MKLQTWVRSPRTRLDLTAGLVDGILNALILASGRLVEAGPRGAMPELALRVGAASALTTVFVFFVAHYAELRAELARAERQLNLLSANKLATSQLGRQAEMEAAAGAVVAALSGLLGAAVPLLACACLPGPGWVGLGVTLALLGALGALMAVSFHGRPVRWAAALMTGGAALAWIGSVLHIAG